MTPAPGRPPSLAVRANIEVPERKLAVTWSLRRNTDKGFAATHTVEIMFKTPADFPVRGISNVPGILMKQAESTRGVPIAGLAVKVTPGFYMIGLSNLDADKERNLHVQIWVSEDQARSPYCRGAYCGFGRLPPSELPGVLADHIKACMVPD